jgi:peptidoglycan/LPS O-acetylase OafA/YrhL
VDGFFFLSGFLVYPSLLRFGRTLPFFQARLARLWPALLTSLILTIFGGAFVTRTSGLEYLGGDTARFFAFNGAFLQGFFHLTGVECGDAPCVMNGSLWTLPWEARCYLALGLCGMLGLARPAVMKWAVAPATLIGALIWDMAPVQDHIGALLGNGIVYYLNTADRLWTLFVLGAAAYLFRDRLKLSWLALLVLLATTVATAQAPFGLHVRAVFVGYGVLCFGFLTARSRAVAGDWPDYSYGMYIYAFPIMLLVHALWPTTSYWLLAAANAAATLPLAAASWHWIEKPVLEASKRARVRRLTAKTA